MFFVRAAFWIFLILLLMPTNDKEKSDFYTAASRTVADLSNFCNRNPEVCDSTGAIFETILHKMRTTVEMLEEMVQPASQRRDATGALPRDPRGEGKPERGTRGDMLSGAASDPLARHAAARRPAAGLARTGAGLARALVGPSGADVVDVPNPHTRPLPKPRFVLHARD